MTLLLPMQVSLMIVCPLFVNKLTQPTPSSHFANIYTLNFPPSWQELERRTRHHPGKESWSDHLGCGGEGGLVATQTNANEMQMSRRWCYPVLTHHLDPGETEKKEGETGGTLLTFRRDIFSNPSLECLHSSHRRMEAGVSWHVMMAGERGLVTDGPPWSVSHILWPMSLIVTLWPLRRPAETSPGHQQSNLNI